MVTKKQVDSLEKVEDQIEKCSSKMESVYEELRPLHAERDKLYKKLEGLIKKKDKIKIKRMKESGKLDWPWLLETNGSDGSMDKYHFMNAEVDKLGLNTSGYCPETCQRVLHVCMTKGDSENLQKTLDGLKVLLPHIKDSEDGTCLIDIFEHSLSEYGSYYMRVNRKERIHIIYKMAWHHESVIKEFKSLKKAIEYIQENLWYKKGEKHG